MDKILHLVKFLVVLILITSLPTYADDNIKEDLVIVGSGSGSSVLKSIGEAFMKKHPNIKVSVPKSIGSGGGIYRVGNDENNKGAINQFLKFLSSKPAKEAIINARGIPVN